MPHQHAKYGLITSTLIPKNADALLRYHMNTLLNRLSTRKKPKPLHRRLRTTSTTQSRNLWTNTGEEFVAQKTKLTLNGHDRFAEQTREYFQIADSHLITTQPSQDSMLRKLNAHKLIQPSRYGSHPVRRYYEGLPSSNEEIAEAHLTNTNNLY